MFLNRQYSKEWRQLSKELRSYDKPYIYEPDSDNIRFLHNKVEYNLWSECHGGYSISIIDREHNTLIDITDFLPKSLEIYKHIFNHNRNVENQRRGSPKKATQARTEYILFGAPQ
jgi:hypothetical protein